MKKMLMNVFLLIISARKNGGNWSKTLCQEKAFRGMRFHLSKVMVVLFIRTRRKRKFLMIFLFRSLPCRHGSSGRRWYWVGKSGNTMPPACCKRLAYGKPLTERSVTSSVPTSEHFLPPAGEKWFVVWSPSVRKRNPTQGIQPHSVNSLCNNIDRKSCLKIVCGLHMSVLLYE